MYTRHGVISRLPLVKASRICSGSRAKEQRKEMDMEKAGMTDLQFKAYLRLLIRDLVSTVELDTKEEMVSRLKALVHDLQCSIES